MDKNEAQSSTKREQNDLVDYWKKWKK